MRCRHGFERSLIPCYECGDGRPARSKADQRKAVGAFRKQVASDKRRGRPAKHGGAGQ